MTYRERSRSILRWFLPLVGLFIGLESVTYPGFLANRIHIGINIWLILGALSLTVFDITYINKNWFRILAWMVVLLAFVFNVMEGFHYPNYVFSSWHINLDALNILAAILLATIYLPRLTIKDFAGLTILSFLFLVSVSSVIKIAGGSAGKISYVAANINTDRKDKLLSLWGPVINYFNFLKTIVKPGQTIVVPSDRQPFRYTSHENFVYYFVYPVSVTTTGTDKINQGQWAVLTSEQSPDSVISKTWPDFPVDSTEILLYDFKNGSYTSIPGAYDPHSLDIEKPWGLIRLERQCRL